MSSFFLFNTLFHQLWENNNSTYPGSSVVRSRLFGRETTLLGEGSEEVKQEMDSSGFLMPQETYQQNHGGLGPRESWGQLEISG